MQIRSHLRLILAASALLISVTIFRGYLPYIGERCILKEPPAILLTMENAYLVGMDGKAKLWSLKAKRVEIGRDRIITSLTNVFDGKIFDQGKTLLTVKAGRAIYDEGQEDLRLSRRIVVKDTDGQMVSADNAHWNSRKATLTSDKRIEFSNKWGKIAGDDMKADLRKKELTMRNVSFSIRINKGDRDAI